MNAKEFFDAEAYFTGLCRKNRMARELGFFPCSCSGIESLQGPLDNFREGKAFFVIDDVNEGKMYQGRGGGFYKKRTFTIFLLHRHEFGNEADRLAKLAICRQLFSQISARMLLDSRKLKSDLTYLGIDNILCRELGKYFLNGCTGLYFMIDVEEPVDLVYDPEEWDG